MQEQWSKVAMGGTLTAETYLNVIKLIISNNCYVSDTFIKLLLLVILENHAIF
jgi:hypothetical protein